MVTLAASSAVVCMRACISDGGRKSERDRQMKREKEREMEREIEEDESFAVLCAVRVHLCVLIRESRENVRGRERWRVRKRTLAVSCAARNASVSLACSCPTLLRQHQTTPPLPAPPNVVWPPAHR